MHKLDSERDAHKFAASLTKTAIENNLISPKASGTDAAKNVLNFYETILNAFSPNNN